jgi:hypothetical protein
MKLRSIYMIHGSKNNPRNHSGSVCPKFKAQKSSSKVLASVFWDKDGILLVDYLEKGITIMTKHCIALNRKMKQQLVSNHRGKLWKEVLFLLDNAALTRMPLHTRNWQIFTLKF